MPFNNNRSAGAPPAVAREPRSRQPNPRTRTTVIVFLLLCLGLVSAQSLPHDRAFWQAIAKNKYAVPEHESADALAHELSGLLASPDPELRDDLAYSIFARWLYRPNILTMPTVLALTDEWRGNLKSGIGESGTNSVLKRSFSALCLSMIAEKEARTPFLGETRYHQLVADALTYLQSERDLRGYDAKLGWIHANAHTADLLQALARSPLLTKEEESQILAAIAVRLSTAPDVYIQGEQDRMASAVLAVIRRPNFDSTSFQPWVASLEEEDKHVWASHLTPETLARYQNHTYFLQGLAVRLSLEPESASIAGFKDRVLGILKSR